MTERQDKSETAFGGSTNIEIRNSKQTRISKTQNSKEAAAGVAALVIPDFDFGLVSDFEIRNSSFRPAGRGSALILTVVLTSLLAIVGVLFLMATRIDKMASSATSEGRELANAVDTVLAQINEDLVEDVPGVTNGQEYYDYPDAANAWLADLEPYAVQIDPNTYKYYWRQISNIRGVIPRGPGDVNVRDVNITTVGERQAILLDPNNRNSVDAKRNYADADGDGVSDAKWFVLPGEMSSRGRPIYAAVRIVDNGGMLNVNTGYAPGNVFDPNAPDTSRVDGSTALQVNVLTLAHAPGTAPTPADAQRLRECRTNYVSNPPESSLADYERLVIWRYLDVLRLDPNHTFTPFDTSDELELRYRFLLDHQAAKNTRVEVWGAFGGNTALSVPRETPGELDDWYLRVAADGLPGAAAALESKYAYRHAVTTYNMDRLITPALATLSGAVMPRRMLNVNANNDAFLLRDVIGAVLSQAMGQDMGGEATQITVNLLDYIDDDDRMTVMPGPRTSKFYGFERPCVYISKVACRQMPDPRSGYLHTSYAIELFKPYFEDLDPQPQEWRLRIQHSPPPGATSAPVPETIYPLAWTGHGTRRFQVLLTEDSAAPLGGTITFKPDESDDGEPVNPQPVYGYSRTQYNNQPQVLPDNNKLEFSENDVIWLERRVGSNWQAVDRSIPLPASLFVPDNQARDIQRNIADDMCVWRQWTLTAVALSSLGIKPSSDEMKLFPTLPPLQAHPANKPLTNIGELGKIFLRNVYLLSPDLAVSDIMVDLQNPIYAELFNYLTVINPARYQLSTDPNQQTAFDPNRPPETRVMGRININTAPSFVLAQLPWMGYSAAGSTDALALQRARAIVGRRNGGVPYKSIGELMQLQEMRALGSDSAADLYTDPTRGPDLTPDNAMDDFEERDLLFTRISNLVTVRSDVFTAYILVRIGENGPQRRVVAVLDRSRVNKLSDRVRIVAEQLVPDPR
jgi:hypothetical protein